MAYPTPAKTPRKRTQNTDFGSAARVLYHDLERDPDQIMPTPSKSRTRRKNAALSLEGLHDEHTPRSNKALHIYTDSKERMPEADNDDDNPFVVKKANKNAKQKAPPEGAISNNRKTRNGMSKAVDEAVDKDEGMVYTLLVQQPKLSPSLHIQLTFNLAAGKRSIANLKTNMQTLKMSH